MLIFTFSDPHGTTLLVSRQQPTSDCGGGCCFDKAVEEFRKLYPTYVPGQMGVVITTKGV